ncbi:hypothetical protein [Helicobacter pylori]|uniref:Uncharacterized protein n=1 Tax=Helicobacter pylori TaxID=210 RepID=A0ABD6QXL8_HELPX|nr:hypothetical protein [Helicobacter pylori]OOQ17872.1 hypothetical protein B0X56_03325 [Helicobacter pylori]PDX02439.1 hypothetical protein BB401_02220 [Helicobacter pylori]WQU60885.1 hypothetical protein KVE06_07810 [Helicobacter pylori]
MGFNFNATTNHNWHFNSEITNKPIAGFLTHQKYLDNLLTAVNNTSETLLVGQPITLKISATLKSSLARIEQNTLEISETPVGANGVFGGIIIHNITDFVMPGDKAPALRPTQTSYVAEIGSGVEVFLPCDLSFLGQASRQFISWDKTNQCYTLKTTGVESVGSQKVSLRSNVVEGKQIVFDPNNTTQTIFKDCYVIKVRLLLNFQFNFV